MIFAIMIFAMGSKSSEQTPAVIEQIKNFKIPKMQELGEYDDWLELYESFADLMDDLENAIDDGELDPENKTYTKEIRLVRKAWQRLLNTARNHESQWGTTSNGRSKAEIAQAMLKDLEDRVSLVINTYLQTMPAENQSAVEATVELTSPLSQLETVSNAFKETNQRLESSFKEFETKQTETQTALAEAKTKKLAGLEFFQDSKTAQELNEQLDDLRQVLVDQILHLSSTSGSVDTLVHLGRLKASLTSDQSIIELDAVARRTALTQQIDELVEEIERKQASLKKLEFDVWAKNEEEIRRIVSNLDKIIEVQSNQVAPLFKLFKEKKQTTEAQICEIIIKLKEKGDLSLLSKIETLIKIRETARASINAVEDSEKQRFLFDWLNTIYTGEFGDKQIDLVELIQNAVRKILNEEKYYTRYFPELSKNNPNSLVSRVRDLEANADAMDLVGLEAKLANLINDFTTLQGVMDNLAIIFNLNLSKENLLSYKLMANLYKIINSIQKKVVKKKKEQEGIDEVVKKVRLIRNKYLTRLKSVQRIEEPHQSYEKSIAYLFGDIEEEIGSLEREYGTLDEIKELKRDVLILKFEKYVFSYQKRMNEMERDVNLEYMGLLDGYFANELLNVAKELSEIYESNWIGNYGGVGKDYFLQLMEELERDFASRFALIKQWVKSTHELMLSAGGRKVPSGENVNPDLTYPVKGETIYNLIHGAAREDLAAFSKERINVTIGRVKYLRLPFASDFESDGSFKSGIKTVEKNGFTFVEEETEISAISLANMMFDAFFRGDWIVTTTSGEVISVADLRNSKNKLIDAVYRRINLIFGVDVVAGVSPMVPISTVNRAFILNTGVFLHPSTEIGTGSAETSDEFFYATHMPEYAENYAEKDKGEFLPDVTHSIIGFPRWGVEVGGKLIHPDWINPPIASRYWRKAMPLIGKKGKVASIKRFNDLRVKLQKYDKRVPSEIIQMRKKKRGYGKLADVLTKLPVFKIKHTRLGWWTDQNGETVWRPHSYMFHNLLEHFPTGDFVILIENGRYLGRRVATLEDYRAAGPIPTRSEKGSVVYGSRHYMDNLFIENGILKVRDPDTGNVSDFYLPGDTRLYDKMPLNDDLFKDVSLTYNYIGDLNAGAVKMFREVFKAKPVDFIRSMGIGAEDPALRINGIRLDVGYMLMSFGDIGKQIKLKKSEKSDQWKNTVDQLVSNGNSSKDSFSQELLAKINQVVLVLIYVACLYITSEFIPAGFRKNIDEIEKYLNALNKGGAITQFEYMYLMIAITEGRSYGGFEQKFVEDWTKQIEGALLFQR